MWTGKRRAERGVTLVEATFTLSILVVLSLMIERALTGMHDASVTMSASPVGSSSAIAATKSTPRATALSGCSR